MRAHFIRIGLIVIAMLLLHVGVYPQNSDDPDLLKQILSHARTEAEKVKDEDSRLVLLENLAAADAKVGNISLAQSEAERLEPIVRTPPNYGDCNYIYEQIVRTQARAGDSEAAYRTAQRISGSKDEAFYTIAVEMAKQGKFSEAIVAINQTIRPGNVRRRAQVFRELAVAAAIEGDQEQAAMLFDRAEDLSAQLRKEAGIQQATIQLPLEVAASRRACGNVAAATSMFSEYRLVIGGVSDDSKRQQYMYEFAAAAAHGGDFDSARKVLSQITDPMRKTQASAAIVHEYLAEGLEDTDAAFSVASSIPSLEYRVSSLASVASAQARKGDKDGAQRTIDICQKLLIHASDDFRAWGTLSVAEAEYELGDKTRANELCDEAIVLTKQFRIHPEREGHSLQAYVARLRASFGDQDGALATARQAGGGSLIQEVAEVESEKGQGASALQWSEKLSDPEEKANALLGIVQGLLDKQQKLQVPGSPSHPRCK
jgi:cytochrome c-type biogenesis protein CcmH/NrfG